MAMDYYESDSTLSEYLGFHFPKGDPLEPILGSQTIPLAQRFPFCMADFWTPDSHGLALDVGAACGRVTFDLARDHAGAIGLDRSARLIEAACSVRDSGMARYLRQIEGDVTENVEIAIDVKGSIEFIVGDAAALPFRSEMFSTVVALNLVDRVPLPGQALEELARVVASGGGLVISSPYTWLETFSPRSEWLGGSRDSEGMKRGSDEIRRRLESRFILEEERRLPFYIPHHARSGQLAVTIVQRYRRKS